MKRDKIGVISSHKCYLLIEKYLNRLQDLVLLSLCIGRDVRGPLDVFQEAWTSTRKEDDSILNYVSKVRERMELAKELVQANMEHSQQIQKYWYNRRARTLQLKPGDKVLVLLPTSTHKLFAQWQRPYLIGRVNYEVVMPEHKKPNVIFHINMLKKWYELLTGEPEGTGFQV